MASLDARKRRKLNPPTGRKLQDTQQSDNEFSSASVESDDYGHDTALHTSKPAASRRVSKEAQKPKRRIHIVKNTSAVNDEFFSQLPNASQNPYQIRGAYWQKAPSPSTSLPGPVARRESSQKQATVGSAAPASLSPPESPDLSPPGRPSHQAPRQGTSQDSQSSRRQPFEKNNIISAEDEALLLEELADFPLDMLSSPADMNPAETDTIDSRNVHDESPPIGNSSSTSRNPARLTASSSNLRQTTLFGGRVEQSPSQANQVHNWPLASRNEAPTHHALDHEAMKTWVYPTNLGSVRDYQYSIVAKGLFSNLLVALPTGLGKTFIAAAIMLNWYRWTKDAQIVFVAPTRPLVAQQVNACFHIAGIPRSATSLLTGNVAPGLRAEEWSEKRVFFMTPQTIVNDLKTGICDPKRIVLVVVDEAHRATGNYAYVEIIRFLRRFNNSFRVLALTATPGSKVETVQEVIDGLGIARTEIRTEDSIDIRQYVHQRSVDSMLFDYDDDMLFVMDLLRNAIKPVLQIVNRMNACWVKDPMALTSYGCQMARTTYMRSDAGRTASFGTKGMVQTILSTLGSLGIAIELLKFHGIAPFYHKMLSFENDDAENGKKGSKYKNQILQHRDFKTMMNTVRGWTRKEDFLGHPKLEYLSQVILNHFIDAGEGRGLEPDISPAATRVMVFTHYRDSAEEIVRVLQRHSPMVRPHVFVGQAASRTSEGMDQKRQQTIIDDFKKGVYNTLIATSIGEEGLDIGQVDLIICYDASASPIRMLQRMGRTGRKRAGNIVVLLMKDKEQMNFEKAKDNYEKIQQMITDGSRFVYHADSSPRIVPKGIDPEVEKRAVEIPIENSQADGELPEPKKRGRPPKRPPKKFHMPDGVITSFLKASEVGADGKQPKKRQSGLKRSPTPDPLPDLETVFLAASQEAELEHNYLDVGGDDVQVVSHPRLDQHSELQREERPSKLVGHGSATWRTIQLLNTMHDMDEEIVQTLERNLQHSDKVQADDALAGRAFLNDDIHDEADIGSHPKPRKAATRKTSKAKAVPKPKVAAKPKSAPRPKKSKAAQRPKKRRKNDSLEDMEGEGIDLMNTDDEHELDDDDDGSDLLDFIDDATQVEPPSSTSSPPDTLPKNGRNPKSNCRRREDDAVTMSQATDGSFPDAEHLVGSRRERSPSQTQGEAPSRTRVKRHIVQDDSDE